jgi:hypothetical protein
MSLEALARAEAWADFHDGHWTKDKPARSGTFPIRDIGREHEVSFHTALVVNHPNGSLLYVRRHEGWWWSKPLPDGFALPNP